MENTTNVFLRGLNNDMHPLTTLKTEYVDALNATAITFNGNELMLQNDMGNTRICDKKTGMIMSLREGFIPTGLVEHGGIMYITSVNKDGVGEVGTIPSPVIRFNITSSEAYIDSQLSTDSYTDISLVKLFPGERFALELDKPSKITVKDYNNKGKALETHYPFFTDEQAVETGLCKLKLYSRTDLGISDLTDLIRKNTEYNWYKFKDSTNSLEFYRLMYPFITPGIPCIKLERENIMNFSLLENSEYGIPYPNVISNDETLNFTVSVTDFVYNSSGPVRISKIIVKLKSIFNNTVNITLVYKYNLNSTEVYLQSLITEKNQRNGSLDGSYRPENPVHGGSLETENSVPTQNYRDTTNSQETTPQAESSEAVLYSWKENENDEFRLHINNCKFTVNSLNNWYSLDVEYFSDYNGKEDDILLGTYNFLFNPSHVLNKTFYNIKFDSDGGKTTGYLDDWEKELQINASKTFSVTPKISYGYPAFYPGILVSRANVADITYTQSVVDNVTGLLDNKAITSENTNKVFSFVKTRQGHKENYLDYSILFNNEKDKIQYDSDNLSNYVTPSFDTDLTVTANDICFYPKEEKDFYKTTTGGNSSNTATIKINNSTLLNTQSSFYIKRMPFADCDLGNSQYLRAKNHNVYGLAANTTEWHSNTTVDGNSARMSKKLGIPAPSANITKKFSQGTDALSDQIYVQFSEEASKELKGKGYTRILGNYSYTENNHKFSSEPNPVTVKLSKYTINPKFGFTSKFTGSNINRNTIWAMTLVENESTESTESTKNAGYYQGIPTQSTLGDKNNLKNNILSGFTPYIDSNKSDNTHICCHTSIWSYGYYTLVSSTYTVELTAGTYFLGAHILEGTLSYSCTDLVEGTFKSTGSGTPDYILFEVETEGTFTFTFTFTGTSNLKITALGLYTYEELTSGPKKIQSRFSNKDFLVFPNFPGFNLTILEGASADNSLRDNLWTMITNVQKEEEEQDVIFNDVIMLKEDANFYWLNFSTGRVLPPQANQRLIGEYTLTQKNWENKTATVTDILNQSIQINL